jgi:hypothetical protein
VVEKMIFGGFYESFRQGIVVGMAVCVGFDVVFTVHFFIFIYRWGFQHSTAV